MVEVMLLKNLSRMKRMVRLKVVEMGPQILRNLQKKTNSETCFMENF
jgi:hypothetical protein